MIVTVDTSALAKLLVDEAGSHAVRSYLRRGAGEGDEFAISTIATTELRRLAIRLDIEPERVEPVVRPFRTIRLTEGILQLAGRLAYPHLGTLDAIHVATALTIESETLLSFDARQSDAAEREGLAVVAPAG